MGSFKINKHFDLKHRQNKRWCDTNLWVAVVLCSKLFKYLLSLLFTLKFECYTLWCTVFNVCLLLLFLNQYKIIFYWFFKKMGHSRPLFLYFRLFNTQLTVNKCSIKIIFWRLLDSNYGPLVSEATALPTEPHNHCLIIFYCWGGKS